MAGRVIKASNTVRVQRNEFSLTDSTMVSIGSATSRNCRDENQDRFCFDSSMGGIFDGHGASEVAAWLALHAPVYLNQLCPKTDSEWEQLFARMDSDLHSRIADANQGSTAVLLQFQLHRPSFPVSTNHTSNGSHSSTGTQQTLLSAYVSNSETSTLTTPAPAAATTNTTTRKRKRATVIDPTIRTRIVSACYARRPPNNVDDDDDDDEEIPATPPIEYVSSQEEEKHESKEEKRKLTSYGPPPLTGVDAVVAAASLPKSSSSSPTSKSVTMDNPNKPRQVDMFDIVLSWCGDSEGIIISPTGQLLYHTRPHKPHHAEETTRIIAAKSKVFERVPGWGARVDGVLNLSRAFGDTAYKKLPTMHHGGNVEQAKKHAVTCIPSIFRCTIPEGSIIVLYSDGVTQYAKWTAVLDVVRILLNTAAESSSLSSSASASSSSSSLTPWLISYTILVMALQAGSRDNITVTTCVFKNKNDTNVIVPAPSTSVSTSSSICPSISIRGTSPRRKEHVTAEDPIFSLVKSLANSQKRPPSKFFKIKIKENCLVDGV